MHIHILFFTLFFIQHLVAGDFARVEEIPPEGIARFLWNPNQYNQCMRGQWTHLSFNSDLLKCLESSRGLIIKETALYIQSSACPLFIHEWSAEKENKLIRLLNQLCERRGITEINIIPSSSAVKEQAISPYATSLFNRDFVERFFEKILWINKLTYFNYEDTEKHPLYVYERTEINTVVIFSNKKYLNIHLRNVRFNNVEWDVEKKVYVTYQTKIQQKSQSIEDQDNEIRALKADHEQLKKQFVFSVIFFCFITVGLMFYLRTPALSKMC